MNWRSIFSRANLIQSWQSCGNEKCAADKWQRWARSRAGIWLNEQWFCCEECSGEWLQSMLASCSRSLPSGRPSVHRLPLGLLMLSRGIIDENQLRTALQVQVEQPGLKIGKCLESMGAVNGGDIIRALGAQHCLPVLLALQPEEDGEVPISLLEESHCVAFRGNYHAGLLYVGFDGAVDRTLLQAIEEVMDRQCEPCIVDTRVIDERLEGRRSNRNPNEVVFDTRLSTLETIRTIRSYVHQVRADALRVAKTRQYLWARISGTRVMHLLFRF